MKLVILATTNRVDPYINVLGAIYKKQNKKETISDIEFVRIKQEYKNELNLKNSIISMLIKLTEGKYYKKEGILKEDDKKLYLEILKNFKSCNVTESEFSEDEYYKHIEKELKSKENVIYDVTTIKKDVLINLSAYFFAYKIKSVYYFDAKKKPEYNEKDLWHNLRSNEYEYENVFENKYIKVALEKYNVSLEKALDENNAKFKVLKFSVIFTLFMFIFLIISFYTKNDFFEKFEQIAIIIGAISNIVSTVSIVSIFLSSKKK